MSITVLTLPQKSWLACSKSFCPLHINKQWVVSRVSWLQAVKKHRPCKSFRLCNEPELSVDGVRGHQKRLSAQIAIYEFNMN